jgi:hypothetical protein
VLEFEERFFGFTTTDKLVFQLAARSQIEHRFDKKAGSDWLVGLEEETQVCT